MDIFGRNMIFATATPKMRCSLLAGRFGLDAAHVWRIFGRPIVVIRGGRYLPAGLMTLTCFHGRILHIGWLYYLMVLGGGLGKPALPRSPHRVLRVRGRLRLLKVESRILRRLRRHEVVHPSLLLGVIGRAHC